VQTPEEVNVNVSDEGAVWTIELARPARSNALDEESVESLLEALSRASAQRARLIVLRGAGRNFCAGFDMSNLDRQTDGDLLRRFVRIEMLLQAVRRSPCVTIGCAQGAALGAGADLLAAATIRIGAPNLRMRFPGFRFGVALGTRHLARMVGADAARSLLLGNRDVDATLALSLGLVQEVLDEDAFAGVADRHESRIAGLDPTAIERILHLTDRGDDDADLADLVRSIAPVGLRNRIEAYRGAQTNARPASATRPSTSH
jgi:enoyl-CoA hydratase/carnithine racemase